MTGNLGERAETLGRQRWWATTAVVGCWIAWITVTLKFVGALPLLRDIPPDALFFGGFAVNAVALLWLGATVLRIKRDRSICGILDDELTRSNARRAYAIGYFVLFASLLVLAAAHSFGLVAPRTVLLALVTIGTAAPMLANLWLERDAAK